MIKGGRKNNLKELKMLGSILMETNQEQEKKDHDELYKKK